MLCSSKNMSFINYLLIFASIANASREGILHIGERVDHPTRHRRLIDTNLNEIVNFEKTGEIKVKSHDGTTKMFKKVLTNKKVSVSQSRSENRNEYVYWYGEDEKDSMLNVVQDSQGNIQGSIVDLNRQEVYQLHTFADKSTMVTITHSSSFYPEADSPSFREEDINDINRSSIPESESEDTPILIMHDPNFFHDEQDELNESATRNLYDDSSDSLGVSIIDVMVLWTERAECKCAGLNDACTPSTLTSGPMEALIRLAIEETNTAFTLSGANVQLNLVHAYRQPDYIDDGKINLTLNALRLNKIPKVHQNREKYGADIVAMITANPSSCGIAYIGPYKHSMFSVTRYDCATGYFSFGHEIGHNLGLNHDRGSKNSCDDQDNYDYGYRDPNGDFRTILAYSCTKNQCDKNKKHGCARIQRFSTPDRYYGGKVLGNDGANNVRAINDVRQSVAEYFPHAFNPSEAPSASPIELPSMSPTASPTKLPTAVPTAVLTSLPTAVPTTSPTTTPSTTPSITPSITPSTKPSTTPSLDFLQFTENYCGNRICESTNNESCATCPQDCSDDCGELSFISATHRYISHSTRGIFFDVAADSNINIYEIEVLIYTLSSCTLCTAELYTKEGTHSGSETSQGDWTLLFNGSFSSGSSTVTFPFDKPIPMESGSQRAFYVSLSDASILFFGLDLSEGEVFASNKDIKICAGKTSESKFGPISHETYGFKRFYGLIKYDLALIPSSKCTITEFLGKTYYLESQGACWRIQLFHSGTLEAHFDNHFCTKDSFTSTEEIYGTFSRIDIDDNKAIFVDGAQSYSGTFHFVEAADLSEPRLIIKDWNISEKVYTVEIMMPSCTWST